MLDLVLVRRVVAVVEVGCCLFRRLMGEVVVHVTAIERIGRIDGLLVTRLWWSCWHLVQSINVLALMCDGVQGVDLAPVAGNGRPNCQALYFVDQGVEVREDLDGRSVQDHLARGSDPRNAVMKNAARQTRVTGKAQPHQAAARDAAEADKESQLLRQFRHSVCIEEISALRRGRRLAEEPPAGGEDRQQKRRKAYFCDPRIGDTAGVQNTERQREWPGIEKREKKDGAGKGN